MAPTVKKNSKHTFTAAIPFTETHWPHLTSTDRDNIMGLLCDLLQPLGDHRRTHIQPSKGKKRKRKSKQAAKADANTSDNPSGPVDLQEVIPPPPQIGNHVLIGLNSVTRHLEALAAQNAPSTKVPAARASESDAHGVPNDGEKTAASDVQTGDSSRESTEPSRPLSLVIIPHNHPPVSLPHAHIPTLVHLSTFGSSISSAARLIALPPGCEPRLASALHIPHVGALGIMEGAPGAKALLEYVREHVGLTQCKWIDEAMKAEWKGVKIDIRKA